MIFKNFRLKIIIRILILGVIMFVFFYSINQDKWYVTSGASFMIIIAILIELIYFIESTNREIGKFLLSIKHKDFSSKYADTGRNNNSFAELRKALHEITDEFQHARIEKELHYQYLLTVFEHTKSAFICFAENGEVELINQAAKNLLQFKKLASIDGLKSLDENLYTTIKNIGSDTEELIKINIDNQIIPINLQCSVFKLKGELYKMVSLHNISEVLDRQELDSWKKLIRILNHEIMNSVTPISSLSSAIHKILLNKKGEKKSIKQISDSEAEDIFEGLETIENRSKGLLKFVTTYKQLTKLPLPRLAEVNINGLINHLVTFMKPEFAKHNIKIHIPDPQHKLMINIDSEMIEQVIINLFLNAIEAMKENDHKELSISSQVSNTNVFLYISDNGPGIQNEILDQIFIPFFTTKKEGSGIGLSLSRQIMQLHKGSISVQSILNKGTTFILKF